MKPNKDIKARVDAGWEQMRPILDKEMPEKEERKFLWWWILIPIILGAGYYILSFEDTADDHTSLSQNDLLANTDATTSNMNQPRKESGQESKYSTQKNIDLNNKTQDKSNDKYLVNEKDESSVIKANKIDTNDLKIPPTVDIAVHDTDEPYHVFIDGKRLDKVTNNNPDVSDEKLLNGLNVKPVITDDKNILSVPHIPMISEYLDIEKRDFITSKLENLAIDMNVTNDAAQDFYYSVGLSGGYVYEMEALSAAIGFSLNRDWNRFKFQGTFSTGHVFFNDKVIEDASVEYRDNQETSDGSNIPGDGDFEEERIVIYNHIVEVNKLDLKGYIAGELSIGYQLLPSISLHNAFGMEKHFIQYLDEVVPEFINSNGSSYEPLTIHSYIFYDEVSLRYKLNQWSIDLGYQYTFKPILQVVSNDIYAHRVQLGVTYDI